MKVTARQPSKFECGQFDDESSVKWELWLKTWQNYATLINITGTKPPVANAGPNAVAEPLFTESIKKVMLLNIAGETITKIYTRISADADTLSEAIDKITKELAPKIDKQHARRLFRTTEWNTYESIDQYHEKLEEAARMCDFNVGRDEEIASAIIQNCNNTELKKRLLWLAEPTLTKVMACCKTQQVVDRSLASKELVNAIVQRPVAPSTSKQVYNASNKSAKTTCYNCDKPFPHEGNGKCEAIGHTCKLCNKKNHYERCCWSKESNQPDWLKQKNVTKKQRRPARKSKKSTHKGKSSSRKRNRSSSKSTPSSSQDSSSTNESSSDDNSSKRRKKKTKHEKRRTHDQKVAAIQMAASEAANQQALLDAMDIFAIKSYADLIRQIKPSNSKHTYKEVELAKTCMQFMVDNGTSRTIIDEPSYRMIVPEHRPKLSRTNVMMYAYQAKRPIDFLGEFQTEIAYETRRKQATILVSKGKNGNVLDGNDAAQLGIVPKQWEQCNALSQYHIGLSQEFPNSFSGRVGLLKNFMATIHVNAKIPSVIQNFRPVPYHLRQQVEDELDRMLQAGIIEEAAGGTEWQLPMVIVTKANGSIRICTDGRPLKKAIIRSRTAPVTINDIKHKLTGSKFFTKIDLKNGYFQIMLDEPSRKYTTFATHRGNYRYLRLNMGLSCSAEIFQREIARILTGIDGQINISDDILIYAKTEVEHDEIVKQVLGRLEESGITINAEKCIFKVNKLTFFGMVFSEDGISPDPDKVQSIMDAKAPETTNELQSFLGLTNFVSGHITDYANIKAPLYDLLKREKRYEWTANHQECFENLKKQLTTQATAYYNPEWNTTVVCDASGIGLGAVLIQEHPITKQRVIVETISRVLSEIEKRYSTIEKESLSIVWACEKLRMYLEGGEFKIITDCRAAELIYKNPLSKPPVRIQRWAMRLSPFHYEILHQSGKTNIADYLSRKPTGPAEIDAALEHQVNATIELQLPKSLTKAEIIKATNRDPLLVAVKQEIINDGEFNTHELRNFRGIKDLLWITSDGIIIANKQILIPESLQDQVIDLAHEAHQGSLKTIELLREKVYFHKLKAKVQHACDTCQLCKLSKIKQNRNPVLMNKIPNGPFEEVAIDFYGPMKEDGSYAMVVTDLYSRWPEVEFIPSVSAKSVLPLLTKIFGRFGFPSIIRSDNGAPFNGKEWIEFCKYRDMEHTPITPYHSQANGVVERFMQNITKQRRIACAANVNYQDCVMRMIFAYRQTPHCTTKVSPTSMIFTCPGNTTRIPSLRLFDKKTDTMRQAEAFDKHRKQQMKDYHDQKPGTDEVILKKNDAVYVRIKEAQSKERPKMTTEIFIVYDICGREVSAVSASGQIVVRDSSQFEKVIWRKPIVNQSTAAEKQTKTKSTPKHSESSPEPLDVSSEIEIIDHIETPTPPATPYEANEQVRLEIDRLRAIKTQNQKDMQKQAENEKSKFLQNKRENFNKIKLAMENQLKTTGKINIETIMNQDIADNIRDYETSLTKPTADEPKTSQTADMESTDEQLWNIINQIDNNSTESSEAKHNLVNEKIMEILKAAKEAANAQTKLDQQAKQLKDTINDKLKKVRNNTVNKAKADKATEQVREAAALLAAEANLKNSKQTPAQQLTSINPTNFYSLRSTTKTFDIIRKSSKSPKLNNGGKASQ